MATKAEKPKAEKPKAEEPAAAADAPPKKKSKKKLIFIVLALLLVVGGGAGAAWHFMKPPVEGEEAESEAVEEEKKEKVPPVFVTLENFVVNLRDDDGDHYLQLGLVFEVTDQAAVDEVKLQMPRIRNGILLLLSSKRSVDVATLEGKQQLTEQILTESRKPMDLPEPSKGIESVYYNTFVIQ